MFLSCGGTDLSLVVHRKSIAFRSVWTRPQQSNSEKEILQGLKPSQILERTTEVVPCYKVWLTVSYFRNLRKMIEGCWHWPAPFEGLPCCALPAELRLADSAKGGCSMQWPQVPGA
jgi:hypothetical protein